MNDDDFFSNLTRVNLAEVMNIIDDELIFNKLPPVINPMEAMNDDEFFNNLPPGFRFRPTDEEIIIHYLLKKINNKRLPRNKINVAKVYESDPDTLTDTFGAAEENEWYFFSSRERKYKGGDRPNRAAGNGYWKASGADRAIKCNGEVVGHKTSLSYFHGKPKPPGVGIKTKWRMHEFTAKDRRPPLQTTRNSMRLDDYVICKLYKTSRNTNEEAATDDIN